MPPGFLPDDSPETRAYKWERLLQGEKMKAVEPSKMFWFVWNEHRSLPRHKHFTEQEAKAEAMRLALASPGEEFHVLGLICSCAHKAVVWRSPHAFFDETIPF